MAAPSREDKGNMVPVRKSFPVVSRGGLYFLSLRVAFRSGAGDTALQNRFAQSPTVSLQTPCSKFPIGAKLLPQLFMLGSYQLWVSLQCLFLSCFSQEKREILMGQGTALEDFENGRFWEPPETLCSVSGLELKKLGSISLHC